MQSKDEHYFNKLNVPKAILYLEKYLRYLRIKTVDKFEMYSSV